MTSSHSEAELALASEGPRRLLAGGTEFEQRLLQAAHAEPVPEAALLRIASTLNTPLEPAGSALSGAGAAKGLSRWITAGVLGGIGLAVPLIASHWRAGESTEQRPLPEQPAPRARLSPAPDSWPMTVTDPPPAAAEPVSAEPPAPRPSPPRPRPRQRAVAENPPPPRPDRSLRAEVRALEAIQQRLAAGRAADAARALEQYQEQFAGGELGLEAELLGVDVALGTGNRQLAQQRASALLARRDGARYRERLNTLLKDAKEGIETNAAPHERAEVLDP